MDEKNVFRVVRRRAKPGSSEAYEALARAMFEDARRFPGFLAAELTRTTTAQRSSKNWAAG